MAIMKTLWHWFHPVNRAPVALFAGGEVFTNFVAIGAYTKHPWLTGTCLVGAVLCLGACVMMCIKAMKALYSQPYVEELETP